MAAIWCRHKEDSEPELEERAMPAALPVMYYWVLCGEVCLGRGLEAALEKVGVGFGGAHWPAKRRELSTAPGRGKHGKEEEKGREEKRKTRFIVPIVPLGFPVVPDVKIAYAASLGAQADPQTSVSAAFHWQE